MNPMSSVEMVSFSGWLKDKFDVVMSYSKTCLKRPLKNGQNKGLKDKW